MKNEEQERCNRSKYTLIDYYIDERNLQKMKCLDSGNFPRMQKKFSINNRRIAESRELPIMGATSQAEITTAPFVDTGSVRVS